MPNEIVVGEAALPFDTGSWVDRSLRIGLSFEGEGYPASWGMAYGDVT